MSKRIKVPKKVIGYGYSGTWSDGGIGWMTSPFVAGAYDRISPSSIDPKRYPEVRDTRQFLCRITIEPLTDKNGRPITKLIPKK